MIFRIDRQGPQYRKAGRNWPGLRGRAFRMIVARTLPVLVALVLASGTGITAARADSLTGTALIRERIALPPGSVFEAVIEDIARADAPATVLARRVIDNPGQPPFAFSIDYDSGALDPRAVYALRATIRREGRLLFATDTITPVLQEGDPQHVEVMLKMLPQTRSGDAGPESAAPVNGAQVIGAHGLRLPATFRGTLPCADCEGIRHHLDLWPGQFYHMRREWLGRGEEPLRRDEIGRWYADPVRGAIVLHGASEMPLFWQVKGPDRLRQMDMAGNPILSGLDLDLTSDGSLEPSDLASLFLLGRMTYMADAALFEECFSGIRYPIAQGGDYLALERAYLEAAASPGAPVMVHVEGGLAPQPVMEGPPRTSLTVDRFIAIRPDDACARPEPQPTLTGIYWRIDSLMGQKVAHEALQREAHVVLQGGADRRLRATVGCNQIIGRHDTGGDALTLAAAASTMMACPAPLDVLEARLREVLAATRRFRLDGQRLLLLDADGRTIAELAAVYLR